MQVIGNITLVGGGTIRNMKPENLATDPTVGELAGYESRLWYNSTEKALKYFDGTSVQTVAKGGNLNDYLRKDGTVAMEADLILSGTDQSGSANNAAVSKGHVETRLGTKQDTVTGAATTIVSADLDTSKALVSDGSGKVAVSAVTTTELGYLSGVTDNVQTQIDSKQDNLGYTPVNQAGDSMFGQLAMNNNKVIGLAAPENANDAARLIDIQNAISGLDFQADVVGYEGDYVDQAGRYIYVDGTSFTDPNTLVPNAGDIVVVDAAGAIQSISYDISVSGENGALTWSTTGGTWLALQGGAWGDFGGLAGVTAGVGLSKSGNVINVNLGAGIAELPSDEVGIDLFLNRGLMLTIDGSTATTDSNGQLAILVGANNSLSFDGAGGLQIASQGVASTMLGDVAGNGLTGGSGVDLAVLASDASITVDASGVKVNEVHLDGLYGRLDGADFTGAVTVIAPTADANPARKLDLDTAVSGINTSISGVNTRISAGQFVYDSTATGTDTASASHTVTHNIGTKYCQVTVVDESDEVVLPDTITFVDGNSLTVTFAIAVKCKVIVTTVAPAA